MPMITNQNFLIAAHALPSVHPVASAFIPAPSTGIAVPHSTASPCEAALSHAIRTVTRFLGRRLPDARMTAPRRILVARVGHVIWGDVRSPRPLLKGNDST
jgi:hypothetical protein